LDAYNQNPSEADAGTFTGFQGQSPWLTEIIVKNSEEIANRRRAKSSSDMGLKKPINQTTPADPLAIIMCPPQRRGLECMFDCAEIGVNCPASRLHPYKPGAEGGKLYNYSGARWGWTHTCAYADPNGDGCTFRISRWSSTLSV
jgi:hypothetical protein